MAYKIQIIDKSQQGSSVVFNARYENLARADRPQITAKALNGKVVKQRSVFKGTVLKEGDTTKGWFDEAGVEYSAKELTFFLGDQEVSQIEQTKVFTIDGFQPLANYTDRYVIGTYYELFPDNNGMKKDFDRQRAEQANAYQMRKLWEYLHTHKVVARGEFCPSSKGFIVSDGYIRAVSFDNDTKWGLEIGVFKEEKIFEHLQEGLPEETVLAQPEKTTRKIKLV